MMLNVNHHCLDKKSSDIHSKRKLLSSRLSTTKWGSVVLLLQKLLQSSHAKQYI